MVEKPLIEKYTKTHLLESFPSYGNKKKIVVSPTFIVFYLGKIKATIHI